MKLCALGESESLTRYTTPAACSTSMKPLTLAYSLADQSFERTKTLGILNLSLRLAEQLSDAEALDGCTVFSNSTLDSRLHLAARSAVQSFEYAAAHRAGRLWWDQWGCAAAARRSACEWLFLPKGFASFVRPPGARLAAYVHDAMHDFYQQRFPGRLSAFERWYFPKTLRATLRHAEVIFTNTEFTKSEVLRLAREAGLPAPRVVAAGIGFHDSAPVPLAKGDHLVALVGRWPHKRSELAIGWLRRWQAETRYAGGIHLIGSLPEGVSLPLGRAWQQHQRLETDAYAELIGSARALVYMSEYEGFGMPPVESLLAGTCPVFSALPALQEVMGIAGCPFQNEEYDSFAQALEKALASFPDQVAAGKAALLARHAWPLVTARVLAELRRA